MKSGKILIVGGYGAVGRAAAKALIELGETRIVIAGRDAAKASAAAAEIGQHLSQSLELIESRLFDVNEPPEDLDGVSTLLCCIDANNSKLAELCARKGLRLVDVTATDSLQRDAERFDAQAKQNGATFLLSVGLSPGLTNLLATALDEKPSQIDLSVLLGIGEKHGRAAIDWMIDEAFSRSLKVRQAAAKVIDYGEGLGGRRSIPFGFSDQFALERTLRSTTVTTRLALESRLLTLLLALMQKLSFAKFLRKALSTNLIMKMTDLGLFGTDRFAIRAEGTSGRSLLARGRGEGEITGFIAALSTLKIHQGEWPSGVFHIHQLFRLSDFEKELVQRGVTIQRG